MDLFLLREIEIYVNNLFSKRFYCLKKAILQGALLISILVLSSCGFNDSSAKVTDQLDKVYTLDLNISTPDTSETNKAYYYVHEWLPREIEKRSEGRINVNVYYDGQLTQLPEMLDAISNGAIDMGYAPMGYYGNQIPETFVTSFPYLEHDVEKVHEIWYSTEISKIFDSALQKHGMTPLMHAYFSPVGWMLNKPVQMIEEMEGLVIISDGELYDQWYGDLGAVGVKAPLFEWYNLLDRNVVDGVYTALITLDAETFNLKEVIDYVIFPPYAPIMSTLIISSKTLEELPEELQEMIFEISKEAEFLAMQAAKEDGKQIMEKLYEFEKAGEIEIITLPDVEVEKFYEKGQPLFDRFASMSEGSAKIVEIIREHNEK